MDDYDSMLNVVEDLPDESIAENEIVSDEEGEIGQGQVRSRSRGRADEQAPKSIAGGYSEGREVRNYKCLKYILREKKTNALIGKLSINSIFRNFV